MTDDGEIVVDEVVDEEVPVATEEEDLDEGYVLEEEEEFPEEAEEDEGPIVHSTDDDY